MARASPTPGTSLITEDEVNDILECPVCRQVPRTPPLFQCEHAHLICSECRPKLKKCPVCRGRLIKTRAVLAEKFLERLPKLCKWSEYGCKRKSAMGCLRAHEIECTFRLVQCLFVPCDEKRTSLKNYIRHIQEKHSCKAMALSGTDADIVSVTLSNSIFASSGVKMGNARHLLHRDFIGKSFFFVWFRNPTGIWHMWVYCLGSAREAKKFTFFLTLGHDEDQELCFKGKTISIDMPIDVASKQENVLGITDSTMKTLMKNQGFTYNVKIF